MSLFGSLKDNFSSVAAEKFLSQYIEKYGKLIDFKLNSQQKKISIKVQLLGEVSPVELYIDNYSVIDEGSKSFIQVHELRTSREWLNLVLRDYIKGKRFEIPAQYKGMIKKVL